MKYFTFLGLSFLISGMAQADIINSKVSVLILEDSVVDDRGWIPLNSVCFRSSDYTQARKSCEDDLQTLNLLATDKAVITGACVPAGDSCPYGFQYLLNAKILVVPSK